jgi:hypothetical protein
MTNDLVTRRFDIAQARQDALASVIFPASKARNFGLGLSIARSAIYFERRTIDGADWHFAVFGREEDQIRKTLMTMDCLSGLKGVMPFINGRPVAWSTKITETLHCFLKALTVDPQSSWCHTIINDDSPSFMILQIRLPGEIPTQPPLRKVRERLIPCQRVGRMWSYDKTETAANLKGRFMSEAARRECDWCPIFSPDALYIKDIEIE